MHAAPHFNSNMRILIATPAPPKSRKGNRITALRWARLQRNLGHTVRLSQHFVRQNCELLIALHARRGARSVQRFAELHPERPIILALTGTDLYRDIRRSAAAARSMQLATRLVLLQPDGLQQLPAELRMKSRVIFQSATAIRRPAQLKRVFEVCVVGHLRTEKDPFRTALAARRLPSESRIQIVHLGAALDAKMEQRARMESQRNPRYQWLGEFAHGRTRQRQARARLLVLSSRIEGGANVLSEALAARVPVLSTRISGSVGILGKDYPGYFDVGDTARLTQLLVRAENDRRWYDQLTARCLRLAALVEPDREQRAWDQLIAESLSSMVRETDS